MLSTLWIKLKMLFKHPQEIKKEYNMVKKDIVKFEVTDGRKPTRSDEVGRPFLLKLSLPVRIAHGSKSRVKLGVSCNLPSVVVGKAGAELFAPNAQLSVELLAGNEVLNMGDGEVVARVFPIDCSNLT